MTKLHTRGRLPERDTDGNFPAYAWPGAYPLYYIDCGGNALCADCATAIDDDPEAFEDERPAYYDVYMEGPDMYCDNCNAVIESAYGDPDADDDESDDE